MWKNAIFGREITLKNSFWIASSKYSQFIGWYAYLWIQLNLPANQLTVYVYYIYILWSNNQKWVGPFFNSLDITTFGCWSIYMHDMYVWIYTLHICIYIVFKQKRIALYKRIKSQTLFIYMHMYTHGTCIYYNDTEQDWNAHNKTM